jgi:hypothetical protein
MHICRVLLLGLPLFAQTPFKTTAQLGVPARVGAVTTVIGTKQVLETGMDREVTLTSAELALTFPNHAENIVAKADEKLLILRGSLRNPEKTSNFNFGPSNAIGFRLWERYTGTGKFNLVFHLDPDTLDRTQKNLKGGESVKFVSIFRIPADFHDFRLGLTTEQAKIFPWYDLNAAMGHIHSIFAAEDGIGAKESATVPAGQSFEMDGLEIAPGGVSRPGRIAGAAVDPAKTTYVVTLKVTNRLMLPARWGWQYVTAELVGADGSVTKSFPDIIDQATDKSWSGDLAAGATVTAQFLFYPSGANRPTTLRFTMGTTGRKVEIGL